MADSVSSERAAVRVRNIDAAHAQLRTAITLWFCGGEAVSIYTLACAAHQVIHDLNRKRKGPDLLLDTLWIKEEFRPQWINLLKDPYNFFRHAGRTQKVEEIVFYPMTSGFFILYSIKGLTGLGVGPEDEELAYLNWLKFSRPQWLTGSAREMLNRVPQETIEAIRDGGKRLFFETYLAAARAQRTAK